MRLLVLAAMAILLAIAEDKPKKDPNAPTPLTTEERLQLRELQLEISNMQLRQREEMAPLAAKHAAEMEPTRNRINKLFRDLQERHRCQTCNLGVDLAWEPQPTQAAKPATPPETKPEAKKAEPAKKVVEQAKK